MSKVRWRHAGWVAGVAAAFFTAAGPQSARADEGGVSFWMPGFGGSFAAAPQQPGLGVATIYYHTTVSADGSVGYARQVNRGNFTTSATASLTAKLDADANIGMVIPSYTFATPVFGGQAAVALITPFGHSSATVDATLNAALGPLGFTRSAGRTDDISGFGDLIPQASLRWNYGVHNVMTYVTGSIPVGAYEATRLANLGLGHAAIDAGGAYTYLNPQTGREFSGTAGFTYNFKNDHTDYQSGVDFHVDLAASQFLNKQLLIGVVGYAYQQISDDTGGGDRVGGFRSRVFGIGPQIGYFFPVGDRQGYVNLKGYKEFGAQNRPEGWNVWLTLSVTPAAKAKQP